MIVESDRIEHIDFDDVIKVFAGQKARKKRF